MKLIRIALLTTMLAALPLMTFAQTVGGPSSKFGFDQAALTVADANAFTYRAYLDGSAVGVVVTTTCVASAVTSVHTCTAPIPALTPGTHTVQLTAANVAGESLKSAAMSFTIVAVPSAPSSLRIIP